MHQHSKNPRSATASPRTAPERRSSTGPSVAEQEVRADAPMTPDTALHLQATVGNAAVARMIRQQRPAGGGQAADAPVQRSTVPDVLRSPGRPLAEPVRTEMELRLGADFRSVRVHDDAAAARSAAEIGARAYTSGDHVVIGHGGSDEHTLAHELSHVIQQRQGPVAGTDSGSGLRVSDPSDRFERAAEANATAALRRPLPEVAALGGARTADHAHASVQRAPSGGTPAAPVASQVALTHLTGDDLEGECGYFERRRALSVNPPQQGVIVQEITRVFDVKEWDGQGWVALPDTAIDGYVTAKNSSVNATVGRYWELWQVDAQGNVSDGGEDTFGLPSIIPGRKRVNTTQGSYTITGDAVFYPTAAAPATLGFTRGGAAPAGGLFSTLTDPSGAIAAAGLTPTGQAVRCRVRVEWDSSSADRYSDVTMT
ncbi:DUF4157 domain-containing protein [Kitasatospora sp. NPDC101183]|uniref:eCIS core domain-containing protein n=1 Tax=Kitasatospora sp. NPDC101183 TaxID=3364100 RepID=UPI00381E1443